jgi:hypothetical protein
LPVATILLLVGIACAWGYLAMIRMPGKSYSGPLPPLGDDGKALAEELRGYVEALAGLGERSVQRPKGLHAGADQIDETLRRAGLTTSRQTFLVDGVACDNVEVEVAGSDGASDVGPTARTGDRPQRDVVVVGAHYDSVPFTTGANDNASGTAAVLALARRFAKAHPRATLRFVAFANEEMPHFQTGTMGSLAYARRCRERGEHVVAMLSLETIGYYSDAEGSQKYPWPLGALYPGKGNFIGFVGDRSSKELVRSAIGAFRRTTEFPSEGAALFRAVPGVGWSDHWAFWHEGYPAIMVTDTAPFRYPHYHKASDTPDKLDYERMARVVTGLAHVLEALTK